ncbi:uncharacterized protein LOC144444563 isoform X3 [Glandiceps talaboti]
MPDAGWKVVIAVICPTYVDRCLPAINLGMSVRKTDCCTFQPQTWQSDKCRTCSREKSDHPSNLSPSPMVADFTMSAMDDIFHSSTRAASSLVSTASTRYQTDECIYYSDVQASTVMHSAASPFLDDSSLKMRSERRITSTTQDDLSLSKSLTSHSYSRNSKYEKELSLAADERTQGVRVRPSADEVISDQNFESVQFAGDFSMYSTYEDLSSLTSDTEKRTPELLSEREANFQFKCSLAESANVNKSLDSLVIQKEAELSEELSQERVRARSRSLGAREGLHTIVKGNTNVGTNSTALNGLGVSPAAGTTLYEVGDEISMSGSVSLADQRDPIVKSAETQDLMSKGSGHQSGKMDCDKAEISQGDKKQASKCIDSSSKTAETKPAELKAVKEAPSTDPESSPAGLSSEAERVGNAVEFINKTEVDELKLIVDKLQHQLDDMEKQAGDLVDENHKLRASQLPDSVKSQEPYKAMIAMQQKLDATESTCDTLKKSNENLEAELEELKVEMDEVRDTFREGEIEEFRDIQKQLDAASKNVRVQQYRLRKAERKIEELETEKKSMDKKLTSLPQRGSKASAENGGAMNDMQQELRVAKDVSVRLHLELENLEEKRGRIEEENQILRRKLVDSEKQRKELKREMEKLRIELRRKEVELLKRKLGQIQDDAVDEEHRRKMKKLQEQEGSIEYDVSALMAELHEKTERERDLEHQLQLVEEEANVMRRKLGEIEHERENLEFELEKYKMHFGTLETPRKEGEKGNISEKEAELRLQLMMVEQEATVMRRKMSELETKNEELQLASGKGGVSAVTAGDRTGSAGGKGSAEVQRHIEEAETLRQHLSDAENEITILSSRLYKYEELSTIGLIHAEDSKEDTELKKYLRKKEEENLAIRKRLVETEIIISMLEDEVKTYKKLNDDAIGHGMKVKGKGAEAKLKSQISLLKQENERIRKKTVDLEIHNEHLQEELHDLSSHKDELTATGGAPPSSPEHSVESDRLPALQGKVNHLEEQLGDLFSIVKGKEHIQEQQEEELKLAQRTLKVASTEARIRQEDLERQLVAAEAKQETLLKHLENVETHAQKLQEELDHTCAVDEENRPGVENKDHLSMLKSLEALLEEERGKTKAAEKKLELLSETASESRSVCSDDTGYKDREKELLRFELNESQSMMAEADDEIRSMQEELTKEREAREKEKQEYERRIVEIGKDKERAVEVERQNSEHQRKMETTAWKTEKTELYEQLEEFKKKTDDLHRKLQTEQSNWSKEDFNNKGAKSGDTTPTSPDWISEKAELERVRQKLEAETQKLENDSSQHKAKNNELKAKLEVTTVKNEELQASRDILMEERSLLHGKLTEAQQEKSEFEVTVKKERSLWEKERATLKFEFENERKRRENELKKTKDENERLRKDRCQEDTGHKQYEAKLKEFERKAKELHELLKKKEESFAKEKSNIIEEQKRHLQTTTQKLEQENQDLKSRLQKREVETQDKMNELQREVEERKNESTQFRSKLKSAEQEQEQLQRKSHDLEGELAKEKSALKESVKMTETRVQSVSSNQKEIDTLTSEKRQLQNKLLANENDWKREKEQLKEAMEKLKTSLKAREEAWINERTTLTDERNVAKSALKEKEAKLTSTTAELTNDKHKLKKELEERKASWDRERKHLQDSLNEKSNNDQSAVREKELEAEVKKLNEKLQHQSAELSSAKEQVAKSEARLKQNEETFKKENLQLSQQTKAKEKVYQGEVSALQLRFETEKRTMKDAKSRLQNQLKTEVREKEHYQQRATDVQSELSSVKAQFDNERQAWLREKSHLQKQATDAKENKRTVAELRRNVESLEHKFSSEEKRRSQIQKAYVTEKSAWEIERSEMQVKIGRLEHNVKGPSKKNKEKFEEQLARLQESWERERTEQKRLLAVSHGQNMDLQRQLDSMDRSAQRDRNDHEVKLALERKEWHDEQKQLQSKIKELEDENKYLKEWERRSKDIQERHRRDHEAWKEERNNYQKKLAEHEKSNKREKSRIDEMITEFEKLREITASLNQVETDSEITPPTSSDKNGKDEIPQRDTRLQRAPEPVITNIVSVQNSSIAPVTFAPEAENTSQITNFEQVKVTTYMPVKAAHAHTHLTGDDGINWNAETGRESTDFELQTSLNEALKEIEKVTDELAQYHAELSMTESHKHLRRSKSHSDVSKHEEEIAKAKQQLYQTSSLSRSTSPYVKSKYVTTDKVVSSPISESKAAKSKKDVRSPSSAPTGQGQPDRLDTDISRGPGSPSSVISETLAKSSISHSTEVTRITSSMALEDIPFADDSQEDRISPPSKLVAHPVMRRPGHFDVRGMLRTTEKKPSLPWMQPDVLSTDVVTNVIDDESLREGRVASTKKRFEKGENGSSRSREASPAPSKTLRSPVYETIVYDDTPTATKTALDQMSPPVKHAVKTPMSPSDSSPPAFTKTSKITEDKSPSPRTPSSPNDSAKVHGRPPVSNKPVSGKKTPDKVSPRQTRDIEHESSSSSSSVLIGKQEHIHPVQPQSEVYARRSKDSTPDREKRVLPGGEREQGNALYLPNISRTPTPPTHDTSPEPTVPVIPGNLTRTKTHMQHLAARQHHPLDIVTEKNKFSPRTARAHFFAETAQSGNAQRPDRFDKSLRSRSLSPKGLRLSEFSLPPQKPVADTRVKKSRDDKQSARDKATGSSKEPASQPSTKDKSQTQPDVKSNTSLPSSATSTAPPTTKEHTKSSTEHRASPKMGVRKHEQQSNTRTASTEDQRKTTKQKTRTKTSNKSGNGDSSSDNVFSQITADVLLLPTVSFARPPQPPRRPPSRWLRKRSLRQEKFTIINIDVIDSTEVRPNFAEHSTMQEGLELFKRFCETAV